MPTELHQTAPKVSWIRQPLFPPWLNRAIDFHPDDSDAVIRLRFTGHARKTLRTTLTAAGFDVSDLTSWSILYGP